MTPTPCGATVAEELSLMLLHADLDGAHAIAERIRTAIQGLRVPPTDGQGALRITARDGVAVSTHEDEQILIAEADSALNKAKRGDRNRTIRAVPRATDASEAGYA